MEHDGRCPYCGAITPCEESDCNAPAGHEYICPECLAKERDRPDEMDVALERRYDHLPEPDDF